MNEAGQRWTGLAERQGHAPPAALAERRTAIEQARQSGFWRADPAPAEHWLGGVRCLRFGAADPPRSVLVHFHGGGFRQGCPEQIADYAARLALRSGLELICPNYRLAPEHPFPAGLHDGIAVLEALLKAGARRIILAGDSAGGALAAGLALLCGRRDIAIEGLILQSPWLDLSVTDPCYATNGESDPLFSRNAAEEAAALYLQGHDPRDSLASPIFAEIDGFPPTFLSVGTGEVLAGDSRRFHVALAAAGVSTTLCCVAGMEHVAVTRDLTLPGAAHVFAATLEFLAETIWT